MSDERQLTAATEAELLLAYDNALVDFKLAERYEHNAHLRGPIHRWLDQLATEMKNRGIEYSFAKAHAAASPNTQEEQRK